MAALLDEAALARILDAADRELYVPDDFERDDVRNDLRNDLEGAATFYRTGKALRVQPRKRRQRVKQIVETAKYLQALVAQGGQWIRFTDISKALDQLIKDVENETPSQLVEVLRLGTVSAFEALIGHLRWTFELYFRDEATVGRPPNRSAVIRPPDGPFIDFASQCLTEFGITKNDGMRYSRESIARALTDERRANPAKL